MPGEVSNLPLSFKIKLLSGNNVVLVECVGYENELFMPQIVKGRITFQNIIPNHRCCDAAAANIQTDQLILPAWTVGDVRILAGAAQAQSNTSTPLAKRIPSLSSFVRNMPRSGKENVEQQLTPEQPRCMPAGNAKSPLHIISIDMLPKLDLTAGHHLPVPELPHLNDSETSFPNQRRGRTMSGSSATHSTKTTETALCDFMHKAPPVRTYARRKPNAPTKAPISWSPLRKKKSSKVSSTKPPSPRAKLVVRRRKLVVDQKRSLGSQKAHNISSPAIIKSKIRSIQVSGKTRQQYEALKGTAFDLLTSTSLGTLSTALNKQFRDACVEKYSDALPNYAELSEAAPLQLDRQVKTLLAKKKRLEKQLTKAQQASVLKGKPR